MTTTVQSWTGRETRALRRALRMSVRDFAERLGVSDRTVSKWEAGQSAVCPRPEMQAALDTVLSRASDDVVLRFTATAGLGTGQESPTSHTFQVDSHKFLPVYLGVDAAAHVAAQSGFVAHSHPWLELARAQRAHLDGDCTLYVFACGVAVFHLRQRRPFNRLASMATWRYTSYEDDLAWAARDLQTLLDGPLGARTCPEYVLSVYGVERAGWTDDELGAALRLMCLPSVLVDRRAAGHPCAVDEAVERRLLQDRFEHSDITPFGVQGVSVGYAAWSGLSYQALAIERALAIEDLIACELDIQMLWTYCRHIQREVEDGRDPQMPSEFGWRFLRAAHSRLTTARARETTQHCLMRQAALATSGLPARLTQAQAALRESTLLGGRVER